MTLVNLLGVVLAVLLLIQRTNCFSLHYSPIIKKTTANSSLRGESSLSMTSLNSFNIAASRINDAFGIIPLCLQPTSKTTTIDDPTAGMTPEEIQNYLDNVGGGMCGYPEFVRVFIGLGLNLSLIVFGIFTVAYVVIGGVNFVLEKKVEDLLKKELPKYPEFSPNFDPLQAVQFRPENESDSYDGPKNKNTLTAGEKPTGPNRAERRFKTKFNKKDDGL